MAEEAQETQKKTLKLRHSDQGPEDPAPALSEAMARPIAAQPKSASNTVSAILALIAVLLFGALLALQGMEISYYGQPPSVFPAPGAIPGTG